MKNQITAIAALTLSCGIASAGPVNAGQIDRSNYQLYNAYSNDSRGALNSVFSDLEPGPDGFVAFDDTLIDSNGELEVAGVADYSSVSNADIVLNQFQFIGGVDQAGGVVFFDFFSSAGDFIDGFGVQLPEAGDFNWTIDLDTAIEISSAGLVQMSIDDEDLAGAGSTAAGRWFLGNAGATIGDSGLAEADPDFNFNFALNTAVPAPGALALFGLGGLAATRRRR